LHSRSTPLTGCFILFYGYQNSAAYVSQINQIDRERVLKKEFR
jgi:hypothetical protein